MITTKGDGFSERAGVILPAAGLGRRLGGQPKQYRLLGQHPLLVQTFTVFDRHPGIDDVVIVVKAGDEEEVDETIRASGPIKSTLHIVSGGASRQASVYAGLKAIADNVGIILVHDAVRPFLAPESITAVLHAIQEHGAAALALPVTDTLRRGDAVIFGNTMPREGMYRMQTPQGATLQIMQKAHRFAIAEGYEATDDVDLIQRAGYPVHYLEGHSMNIKVTTPADWQLAQWIWPYWRKRLDANLK